MQKSFGGKDVGVTRNGGGRLGDDIVDEEGEEEDGMGGEEGSGGESDDGQDDWDIDADPIEVLSLSPRDSGLGASEEGSGRSSPLRRVISSGLD